LKNKSIHLCVVAQFIARVPINADSKRAERNELRNYTQILLYTIA